MKPLLYTHPFSSYSQKVLIALYENDTPFTARTLSPEDPTAMTELTALSPLRKFPVLVDDGNVIAESSVIIEYLMIYHPGEMRLIPSETRAALEVRMMDRYFDNYVMTPMQNIVADFLRAADRRDPFGVAQTKSQLTRVYEWLDGVMAGRRWAAGEQFSLADCAAAPSLFYADWVHEIAGNCPNLRAYRRRLLERPSFARAVDEARPYRGFFPPGAPARD
ncbi:MAG TPA: glutathione S-transferase family protein [Steroidobacteraceae bacterium]|jgi:glutathione S-transferase